MSTAKKYNFLSIAQLSWRWLNARRPLIKERLYHYGLLMRLHRPVGSLLFLWPTLWALWLAAEGLPSLKLLFVFVSGVFIMRSAGCVINDIVDRDVDRYVERTRNRPLITGAVSLREALVLFAVLVTLSALLVLLLNWFAIALAVAGLALAASYPLMKRLTYLPQFYLGLAFGWGIPTAFAAQTNSLPPLAWLLLVANVLWTVVYDTQYAMVDREDDLKIGVKSTAILFDDADRMFIGIFQILFLLAMVLLGNQAALGVPYYLALFVAAVLFGYQQVLIRDRDPHSCFQAFMNNNWVGAVIFAGFVVDYLY